MISNNKYRGVALIAILAVLTVLAIMSTVFIVQMNIESKTSQTLLLKEETEMIMLSALEHVKAQLYSDSISNPGYDASSEAWNKNFKSASKNSNKSTQINLADTDKAKWIYVKNKEGEIIGRYAISIEDESGKINANAASAINSKRQNQGLETSEIILSDGKNKGIPISAKSAKKIINYRYGKDKMPGQANVDDNNNNVSLMYDGLDNNANGIIDEVNEGIDEPQEYNPDTPVWDDRSFYSVRDVSKVCGIKSPKAVSYLKKYCTVSSHTRDTFWSDERQKMMLPINLNVSTTRQIHRVLRRGNKKKPFEGSSKNLRILAANITDYRDENQVLTTLGSDYGIESVCFNEIMAMNGNFTLESDFEGWAPRFGWWFNHYSEVSPFYKYNYREAWKIKNVTKLGRKRNALFAGEKVVLPVAKISLKDPERWNSSHGLDKNLYRRLTGGKFINDVFKNAIFILIKDKAGNDRIHYPIAGNDEKNLYVCYDDNKKYNFAELTNANPNIRVEIDTMWWAEAANWCIFPEQTEVWWVNTRFDPKIKRPDNLYYYLFFAEQSFDRDISDWSCHWPLVGNDFPRRRPYKGYNRYLDTDGIINSKSETRMSKITAAELKGTTLRLPKGESEMDLLRFPYKNGEAIRAKNGYIKVIVTSGKNTGYVGGIHKTSDRKAFENKNCIDAMYVMRPDIVEIVNISDKPISLNNWQIIVNTGDSVNRVGLIRNVPHYSIDRHGRYNDPNPTIPPHGYFYLTNNRNFFDKVYGNVKSGTWGDSQKELYGCYELPQSLWGVRYKIVNIRRDHVKVKGANWKNDQMKGEMVEFQSTKPHPKSNGISGIRRGIVGNTKDILILNVDAYGTGVRKGDDALIVGLPGAGGFLSLTLKNEYNQIATRIVEYGSLKPEQIEYSTQKIDPTRYEWQVSKHPTFGGDEETARNHGVAANVKNQANIKNNHFSSLVELQKVKTAKKFEKIGTTGKGSFQVLKAIGQYLTTSGIRLDPEEKYVHISGWEPAFAEAIYSKSGVIKAQNVNWKPNIWQYQKLRILSGPQCGETFLVTGNSKNSISVDGYSVPGGKLLHINKGDKFALGPGYSTPMYYTTREAEEGIWEWKNRNIAKTYYGLYLAGLNDSIDTTEFLEENYNAEIELFVYNYKKNTFEKMPIENENMPKYISDLFGKPGSKIGRFQYEKSDMVYCGIIGPDNISSKGGIKVKLIAHGVNNEKSSGIAWFDYLYLAPGSSYGKININTAPVRILTSLPGVSRSLAKNIFNGVNSFGKAVLKPYKVKTDILDVKGMTAENFAKICNLITTRSDQFRANIIAQTLKPKGKADKYGNPTDFIVTSTKKQSFLVDRSNLTAISPDKVDISVTIDN